MNQMTFAEPAHDERGCFVYVEGRVTYLLHKVAKVGLSTGAHDIPDGFQLYAECGVAKSVPLLDFSNSDERYHLTYTKCPTCFPPETKP